jgi:hypothetical protein
MTGVNAKKIHTESWATTEDLSSNQYYGVTMSGDRTVDLQDALTDIPAGILQNKPTSGQVADVLVAGRTPGVAAEAITAGQQVRIDAAGKFAIFAVDTDTTAYCCGYCVVGAGADGEIGEFIVNCATCFRGEE